jgi:hypothetical protein
VTLSPSTSAWISQAVDHMASNTSTDTSEIDSTRRKVDRRSMRSPSPKTIATSSTP